jgi:uncharacterized protein (TIGR02001 family)
MGTRSIGSTVSVVLLAGSLSAVVVAQEEVVAERVEGSGDSAVTGNLGVTSNYIWRGASQTSDAPAVQGGIDYGHGSGFYIGAWASNVNFGDSSDIIEDPDTGDLSIETSSGAQYELDSYIGWGGDLTENVALDLGYVYYHYGQIESGSDFGEIYANVGLWWFDVGAYYTTNSQIDDSDANADDSQGFVTGDISYYGAFNIDLAQSWSLGLTIGQYDFTNDGNVGVNGDRADLSYTYGQIDLTKSGGRYGDFTLSVSQAGEQANSGNDNPRVFVTWTKGWYQRK